MTEPVLIADVLRCCRQQLRDASPHAMVALPHTDGELSGLIVQLEEILLATADDAEEAAARYGSRAREAAGAFGRLAIPLTTWERVGGCVQPVAPGGHFELVPLLFVRLDRDDLVRIREAVTGLDDPEIRRAVSGLAGDEPAGRQVVEGAQRLLALLSLPWDDDVDALRARLASGPTKRVVLSFDEHVAYERVTGRILGAWHDNDPLARFIYRG